MSDSVKQEAERLFAEAHAVYQELGRATASGLAEPQLQAIRDAWQAKHRVWWNYVQKQILKKPGIVMDFVDLAGPDPLKGR